MRQINDPPVQLPIKRHFRRLNTYWLSIHTPVLLARSRRGRSWRGVQSGPPAARLDTGSAAWRPPAARHGSGTTSDWRLSAPECAACCLSSAAPWSESTRGVFLSWVSGGNRNVWIETNKVNGGSPDLLCVDGRHLGDAGDLNHSFGVFSQV